MLSICYESLSVMLQNIIRCRQNTLLNVAESLSQQPASHQPASHKPASHKPDSNADANRGKDFKQTLPKGKRKNKTKFPRLSKTQVLELKLSSDSDFE